MRARVHGRQVLLNRGNPYPFFLQDYPAFNAPLIELVHLTAKVVASPICFADVGAAIGDTVLLLKERCGSDLGKSICIEGDREFHALLASNMAQFDDVECVCALLAAKSIEVRSLVKHHLGTASALGEDLAQAIPLDAVPEVFKQAIHVLKTDVDGFDGAVLSGARNLLQRCAPAVIFEWHPKLMDLTGNDWATPFEVLESCGYTRYAWFNNPGSFSHFSCAGGLAAVERLRKHLLAVNDRADKHFDVVALSAHSRIDEVELSQLEHARRFLTPAEQRRCG